jgi:hypothetical protein
MGCHRLERPVSELPFCATSKSLSRLNEMMKSREYQEDLLGNRKNRPGKDEDTL